jgi:hypothetical protein
MSLSFHAICERSLLVNAGVSIKSSPLVAGLPRPVIDLWHWLKPKADVGNTECSPRRPHHQAPGRTETGGLPSI